MVRTEKHWQEVAVGERFEFGKNWQNFLRRLTPERITQAEQSLRSMLHVADLEGTAMLDIGSGSGLFELGGQAAGYARVYSFDYDPQSVACTRLLRERFSQRRSAVDQLPRGRCSTSTTSEIAGQVRSGLFLGGVAPHRGHVAGARTTRQVTPHG